MAQVISPNTQRPDDALTTIMKGLSIASQVYGIRADMAKLDEYKQQQQHQQDLAEGKYNKNEQLQLGEKFDISPNAPTNGMPAYQATDAASGSPLYLSLKKDTSPLLTKVNTIRNGKPVEIAVDLKTGRELGVWQSPSEGKTREVDTVDEQGNPIKKIVPDVAGQQFAAAPKADKTPNKDQFDAALYGKRMQTANEVFDKLASQGFDRTSNANSLKAMILPEALKSGELKQQEQAEHNFLTAVLRRESGAAISASEFAMGDQQYFPRIGDTPEVVAQKAQNREQAIAAMKGASGNAWNLIETPSIASVKKDTSGQAIAAPAQQGPSALDLLKIKAANGDKQAQDYLNSLNKGK